MAVGAGSAKNGAASVGRYMMTDVLRVFAIVCVAFVFGKIVSKIKMPAILGWLIAGIVFGPYLVGIVDFGIMEAAWYKGAVSVFECSAGLMIGTEILFKKMKSYGKQVVGITFIQSIGTFLFVSLCFAVVFLLTDFPVWLSLIFGGIALATAPAPALSIVNEFKTKGPVTRTLIPLAAMDDVIGVVVFFTVISVISATAAGGSVSVWTIAGSVFLPFAIGIATGIPAGFLIKKKRKALPSMAVLLSFLAATAAIGLVFDIFVFGEKTLNYILTGMAFSATFANIAGEERTEELMRAFDPILGVSLVVVIVNLGMPLDYRAIAGAGVYTAVYILSRAVGKIGGAYLGGVMTKAEPSVKKFLGFTLLPHSGVSLIFAGIAISALSVTFPASAQLIQGTIAAAAIINEIIAVLLAKQAFKWAGELPEQTAEPT